MESMQSLNFDFGGKKVTREKVLEFCKLLIEKYPDYSENLDVIRKKILRKNKAVLSELITFARTVNDDNLKMLIKQLIQIIMDNPKILKK